MQSNLRQAQVIHRTFCFTLLKNCLKCIKKPTTALWFYGCNFFCIRLKSGNGCYHSIQNLLSSRLLTKNIEIKLYRNIILPVVLHGCETWSLTLREECRLRMLEDRVMRRIFRIFGPKGEEITGEW